MHEDEKTVIFVLEDAPVEILLVFLLFLCGFLRCEFKHSLEPRHPLRLELGLVCAGVYCRLRLDSQRFRWSETHELEWRKLGDTVHLGIEVTASKTNPNHADGRRRNV